MIVPGINQILAEKLESNKHPVTLVTLVCYFELLEIIRYCSVPLLFVAKQEIIINALLSQEGRGHWTVSYTSPQSFIITFTHFLALQNWVYFTVCSKQEIIINALLSTNIEINYINPFWEG